MKETVYKIVDGKFVFREEEDGALIFNPDTGNIHALNRTGAIIWKSCVRGVTISKLSSLLKKDYALKDDTKIKKDIAHFLKQLKKNKMLIER